MSLPFKVLDGDGYVVLDIFEPLTAQLPQGLGIGLKAVESLYGLLVPAAGGVRHSAHLLHQADQRGGFNISDPDGEIRIRILDIYRYGNCAKTCNYKNLKLIL